MLGGAAAALAHHAGTTLSDEARPTLPRVLATWSLDPLVVGPLAVALALYGWAVRAAADRFPGAAWPRRRTAAFLAGLGTVAVALASPIDRYADVLFWVHMVQHLLLILVAAPLLLLGAPVTLAMRACGPSGRRRIGAVTGSRAARMLSRPAVAWALFAAVMVGSHFSALYELSLEHAWVHAVEHALYLGSALLFWFPVIGLDPSRHRLSHPLRLVYLLAAGPVNTVTALAIYSGSRPLYLRYVELARDWGPSPLADQRMAGVLMWLAGDLGLLAAAGLVLLAWMRHDRVADARLDRRLDAALGAGGDEVQDELVAEQVRRHEDP